MSTRNPEPAPPPSLPPAVATRPPAQPRSATRAAAPSSNTSTRALLISGAVLLTLLFAYNLALWRAAKTSQRHQLLARLDRLPADTEVLFLGNSLVEAGCDVDAFAKAWRDPRAVPRTVNIALGATSPVEHALILKRAYAQHIRPKYVVYGFFDDQLNAPVRGDWSDLVGNRAFSCFFPEDAAALYAPGSWLKRWQLWITGHVPMLAERSSAWGKTETLRRAIEQIGMPHSKMNRFGRVGDFAALEAKDVPDFNRRCDAALHGGGMFSPPVREIIKLTRDHGAQLVLLEMPMPSHHRKLFYSSPRWAELRTALENRARQDHLLFLSANDWMLDDSAFEDATHLSEQGARLFSQRLSAALSDLRFSPRIAGAVK